MRTRLWVVGLCALLVGLTAVPSLAKPAGAKPDPWAEFRAAKALEGWSEVAPAVLERRLGPTKVEHLALGRDGLAWVVVDLYGKLRTLESEYDKWPSSELAAAIDELHGVIVRAAQEMRSMPEGFGSSLTNVIGPSCSSICYSATADAYPLTSSQGVGAVAAATFNSSCGYTGETYAYAYARATSGTTTTTIIQQDPKTGSPITSSAAATVSGGSISGTPCYSSANSYAQSSALGIAYSTSDENFSCPAVPAPTVTISGTTYESFFTFACRSRTWTSTVTGGASPFTYQWKYDGTVVGSGSSYTRTLCPGDYQFTLTLTVTGSNSVSGVDTHDVIVEDYTGGGCYAPICP